MKPGRILLALLILGIVGYFAIPPLFANFLSDGGSSLTYEPVSFDVLSGFDTGEPTPEEMYEAMQRMAFSEQYGSLEEMEGFQSELPSIPRENIPDTILVHDGKKVALSGFMVPTIVTDEGINGFLLVKNQALCCFGLTPRLNDFVHVSLPPERSIDYVSDVPITVYGTLEIGMKQADDLHSLYRLAAADVTIPDQFFETKENVEDIQQRLMDKGSKF